MQMDVAEPTVSGGTTLSLTPYIGKTVIFMSITSYMSNKVNGVSVPGNYITDSAGCQYELLYRKYWATAMGNERMVTLNSYRITNIEKNSYISMRKTFSDSHGYQRGFIIY